MVSARQTWDRLCKEAQALRAEQAEAQQAGDTERLRELAIRARELEERSNEFVNSLKPRWPSERGE